MKRDSIGMAVAGGLAGLVTGLFAAGGGMILVPLLGLLTGLQDREIFPASITIILAICLVSLGVTALQTGLPWGASLPYLLGSALGGWGAGKWGHKVPAAWLHRGLGMLVLWGGIRYLW